MRLIVDATILFSALIKDTSTAKKLFDEQLKFYAPDFLFEEFTKHEDYILKKIYRTKENFETFYKFCDSEDILEL